MLFEGIVEMAVSVKAAASVTASIEVAAVATIIFFRDVSQAMGPHGRFLRLMLAWTMLDTFVR